MKVYLGKRKVIRWNPCSLFQKGNKKEKVGKWTINYCSPGVWIFGSGDMIEAISVSAGTKTIHYITSIITATDSRPSGGWHYPLLSHICDSNHRLMHRLLRLQCYSMQLFGHLPRDSRWKLGSLLSLTHGITQDEHNIEFVEATNDSVGVY